MMLLLLLRCHFVTVCRKCGLLLPKATSLNYWSVCVCVVFICIIIKQSSWKFLISHCRLCKNQEELFMNWVMLKLELMNIYRVILWYSNSHLSVMWREGGWEICLFIDYVRGKYEESIRACHHKRGTCKAVSIKGSKVMCCRKRLHRDESRGNGKGRPWLDACNSLRTTDKHPHHLEFNLTFKLHCDHSGLCV